VMLSDETAMGKYPIETVKAMRKVILYTQNHSMMLPLPRDPETDNHTYDALSAAAARLAENIDADLILCQTASGATARAMAAQRPNLPIISVTPNQRVANQLGLMYANSAFVRPYSETYGLDLAKELKDSGYLQLKDGKEELKVVLVSGDKDKRGTDTIKVRYV